jgi:hypothetical protein
VDDTKGEEAHPPREEDPRERKREDAEAFRAAALRYSRISARMKNHRR